MTDGRPRIIVIDYRLGNTHNVLRALARSGADAALSAEPADIVGADGIVLPGVGAFAPAMESLFETGAAGALRKVAERGTPLLAICLGMQLLADESEEGGHHRGLGLTPGRVRRLTPDEAGTGGAAPKVPHVGWAAVEEVPGRAPGDAAAVGAGDQMYFLHSYVLEPSDAASRCAETNYAGDRFCSGLRQETILGVQFHPELSAGGGQRLIDGFTRWAAAGIGGRRDSA